MMQDADAHGKDAHGHVSLETGARVTGFSSSLVTSFVVHSVILGAALVSLPQVASLDIAAPPSISVDIVAQSLPTQARGAETGSQDVRPSPVPQTVRDDVMATQPQGVLAAPPPRQVFQDAPDVDAPPPKRVPVAVEPEVSAEPVDEDRPRAVPDKPRLEREDVDIEIAAVAQQPRVRPQIAPDDIADVTPSPVESVEPVDEVDPLQDTLSDVTDPQTAAVDAQTATPTQEQTQPQNDQALGHRAGTGETLSRVLYDGLQERIRAQILPCWSPPLSAVDGGGTVDVLISFTPEGQVQGTPQVVGRAGGASSALVSSALRAIKKCAPLDLPQSQYAQTNGWNKIEFRFDPSDVF